MDRIYESGAAASPPAAPDSPSSGYPSTGNPSLGIPATKPGPYWYHMITESLANVIAEASLPLNHSDLTLLNQAIASIAQARAAAAIAALVDSSPAALDTLNELAAALGDDPNFATTITNMLALKAPLDSPALTGNPTAPTVVQGTNNDRLATTAFVQAEHDARNIVTGNWTPTGTAVTNVSAVTVINGYYTRVGSRVMFDIAVTITPTAIGYIAITLSLPIASGFTNSHAAAGVGCQTSGADQDYGSISGDAATDTLKLNARSQTLDARTWRLVGAYEII